MKTFIPFTFVLFIHAFAFAADELGTTLIGKWTWIGGQQYKFAADHTGTMTQGGNTVKLRWRVDGAKVPITLLRPDGQEAFTREITRGASADELTLTIPPKTEGIELTRVGTHPKRIDEEQESVCLNRLAAIASASRAYMVDHDGVLPKSIEELFPDYMPESPSTRSALVSPFLARPKGSKLRTFDARREFIQAQAGHGCSPLQIQITAWKAFCVSGNGQVGAHHRQMTAAPNQAVELTSSARHAGCCLADSAAPVAPPGGGSSPWGR